jgi:hypothetical protein
MKLEGEMERERETDVGFISMHAQDMEHERDKTRETER